MGKEIPKTLVRIYKTPIIPFFQKKEITYKYDYSVIYDENSGLHGPVAEEILSEEKLIGAVLECLNNFKDRGYDVSNRTVEYKTFEENNDSLMSDHFSMCLEELL